MTGFWLYMFLITLLIPLIMIGFGRLFSKQAPKKINYIFGYRTNRSMKNRDTWEFAHHYIGKLWFRMGIVLLVLSVGTMLLHAGRDAATVGLWGGVFVGVQTVVLMLSVIPVELGLKKTFDENGQRKQ